MAETPRLDLPYLAASQAQKEVYHNISLDRLDLLVQCAVLDRNLAAPPATPALGDAYIVATGATGVWAGHDHALALYVSSQWEFIAPLPGFQCWVLDEVVQVVWSGTAWTIVSAGGGGGVTTLLALTDTPDSYSGQAGKALLVNAGETAVEFGTVTGGSGAPLDAAYLVGASHASLTAERVVTDSPNITWDLSTAGQVKATVPAGSLLLSQIEPVPTQRLLGRGAPGDGDLHTISLGTGLTLSGSTLSATGGGSTDFLGLTDTPDSYSGQAGKVVQVNAGATALEFGTAGGGLDTEAVQDVVGAMLTDSSTLDFTFDDTAGTVTGSVTDASITEAKLSLSDVTTHNVSPTQHGLVPKAPNVATQFLNGTGAWSTPAGGGSYTDEQAQDAVGGILTNTPAIIFTYNDATPAISAALGFGGVTSDRIADDAVTFAKMQNITDARLLGRSTGGGPGNIGELTVGAGLSLSGGVLTATAVPAGTPLSVARYAASGTALEASPTVVVDASGSLGVGTATPSTRLTVHNGTTTLSRDDGATTQLTLTNASVLTRQIQWQTDGVARWNMGVSADAESGSHQGSNWSLARRADDGTALSTVLRCERATGNVQQGTFATDAAARNLWILGSGIGPGAGVTFANAIAQWAADRGGVANKMALHVQVEDGTQHVLGDLVGLGTLCSATLGSGAAYQALTVKGSTLYVGQSSVQERALALVQSSFVVSTDATRTARLTLSAYDATAAREGLRVEADGTAARLAFFGQPAVGRQTVPAAATDAGTTQTLANALRTALVTLGLCV